jgi:hypothetical protein
LSPYVDDRLEADRRHDLEVHLTSCSHCSEELASLRQVLATLRSLDAPPAPDLLPGIRRKLAAAPWWRVLAERFTAPWPASLPWHGLALATTSLLVIVIVNTPHVRRSSVFQRADSSNGFLNMGAKDEVRRERVSGGKQAVSQETDQLGPPFLGDASSPSPLLSPSKGEGKGEGSAGFWQRAKLRDAIRQDAVESQALTTPSGSESISHLNAAVGGTSPPPPVIQGATAVLELRWEVPDPQVTAERILDWVRANGGLAVATNETHLSLTLPALAVPGFLQQWAPERAALPASPASSAAWLTISLDLSPTQP